MHIAIVTGVSGAGKSTALRALEDYGFYCVDNVPLPLIAPMIDWFVSESEVDKLALAIDARQHQYLSGCWQLLDRLTNQEHQVDVLFLDASDEELLRRYSASRRLHPLSSNDLMVGIARDRDTVAEIRKMADILDTSHLNVHQLKGLIQDRYGRAGATGLAVMLLSFGFRNGLPIESNMVFDVRFLPNPYFVPELTDRDGREEDVSRYVLDNQDAQTMLDHIEATLRFTLPQFEKERKLYLTVSIGCTGGRHRSVAMVEELRLRFQDKWDVSVRHRELDVRN